MIWSGAVTTFAMIVWLLVEQARKAWEIDDLEQEIRELNEELAKMRAKGGST